jgi:protein TonB
LQSRREGYNVRSSNRQSNFSQTYSSSYAPAFRQLRVSMLIVAVAVVAGGCSFIKERVETVKEAIDNKPATTSAGGSTASTLEAYKREVGLRIQEVNSTKVYIVRPQALLHAVVVVRFVIDAQGGLVRSEIMRSHDKTAEAIAVSSLRATAPFPKPPPALLTAGRLEMSESWLFNNDGKFQVRSVALQQMDR